MIFSNGLDDKVRDGTKTQTRRLVKDGDEAKYAVPSGEIAQVYRKGRLLWETYRFYSIQSGRGKKGNGRFHILKIRRESLQDISIIDCYAEGVVEVVGHWDEGSGNVNIREHFGKMWNNIHKKPGDRWASNPSVWVLEIERI